MRTKCNTCLCRTCLNICCDRKNCPGKKESCENYSGFRQLSIFEPPPQPPQYQSAPRYSWEHYGISEERYRQLTEYIQSGKYNSIASQAAHRADKIVAEYILLSIKQNLSYDTLEKLWAHGGIGRIPCSRTGFYYTKKYFFHLMDLEMRRIGK